MIELDTADAAVGLSADTMERRALRIIGAVRDTGISGGKPRKWNLPRVCEHSVLPLPHGCWQDEGRSPYAKYGAERWCDACIAYAALTGTLPRPVQTIDMSMAPKLESHDAQ